MLVLLPFAYLWFRLINNLRLEWATNPQYSYGWVVPFLCVGLLMGRWQAARDCGTTGLQDYGLAGRGPWSVVLFFATLAFLYLPTRLVEEATPEWRPIQWALGIEAIGLTLCAVYLGKGRGWLRQVAFPICFFFVAIPWPTVIEAPVIQSLTRINSAVTVELLGWFGIPAMQHGNLIEVSTGTVGVSEACSGIRSFQTSLMISLFFGEFYAMGLWRRLLLVPAGFILAMAFNVCRMSFLTIVAAKNGVAAIAQYHDPAGILITLVCTAGMWGVAVLFSKRLKAETLKAEMGEQKAQGRGQTSEVRGQLSEVRGPSAREMAAPISLGRSRDSASQFSAFQRLGLALLVWLALVEVGAELWYRHLESHLAPSPQWSVMFPTDNPTFHTLPISPDTAGLLRFDEGKQGAWQEADGSRWQAFHFNWFPGRVAGYLAKRHTPEACLPAAGWKMSSGPELMVMRIKDIELPMRHYVFENSGGTIQVFQCRWEEGMSKQAYVQDETSEFNLVRGIWAGRGNKGQKVLEFIISGYQDSEQAQAALARQLQAMIQIDKPKS
ncbi:MAG: exosortase/archaeosortase family protein [Verrucomicrobiota bacterium]|jgi:exosortase